MINGYRHVISLYYYFLIVIVSCPPSHPTRTPLSHTPTPHHPSLTAPLSHPHPTILSPHPSLTPTPDGAIYPCNKDEVRRCSQLCLTTVAFAKKPPCACTDGMKISRDNYTCIPLGKPPRKHNYAIDIKSKLTIWPTTFYL